MPCSADTDSQVTFRRLSAVDWRHCRPQAVGVFGQCRMQVWRSTLLFWLYRLWWSAFLFCMRLFLFAALCGVLFFLCLCLDLWLCFALCQRIFDCGLRNFALARATSPFQSPRAGPQRFLVWVRICGCCALENCKAKCPLPAWCAAQSIAVGDFVTVFVRLSASFFFPYPTKVKLSKKQKIP